MASNDTVSFLSTQWQSSGINTGDTVLIHSSAKRTLSEHGISPEELLESFMQSVGETGTLLLPLFNFDFCSGIPFDIGTTQSHMGALSEAARTHPNAVRTGHPVYSFAVIGKQAKQFQGLCNRSGYGADSPFAMLHNMNGKIAVLDLPDQNSMTFYHYVEESLDVPYRYHKAFTAPYTNAEGHTNDDTFSIFVRDVEAGVQTHVAEMETHLWEQGLYQGKKPHHGTGLRSISASSLYDATKEIIESGRAEGMLYRIKEKMA